MPLIVLEGIDGCGKTTQCDLLEERLRRAGRRVRRLREPGGTALGEAVRGILLDRGTRASPLSELLLYQVARAQLCDEVVRPALEEGDTVLLDRFWFSTVAYQGYGLGLDLTQVRAAVAVAVGDLRCDLALWCALDPELALRRRAAARGEDRIEARGLEYQRRVHAGYAAMAAAGELEVLDASGPVEVVAEAVWERALRL